MKQDAHLELSWEALQNIGRLSYSQINPIAILPSKHTKGL